MQQNVLTLLDAIGLVLVAVGAGLMTAGAFAFVWHIYGPQVLTGGLGAVVAGIVLSLGSWLAYRRSQGNSVPAPVSEADR